MLVEERVPLYDDSLEFYVCDKSCIFCRINNDG